MCQAVAINTRLTKGVTGIGVTGMAYLDPHRSVQPGTFGSRRSP
jgi:hypothetical protein